MLFDNKIEAWRYGPVVPDVYYDYNGNLSNKIRGVSYSGELTQNEKTIVESICSKLINVEPWSLRNLIKFKKYMQMLRILYIDYLHMFLYFNL